VLARHVLDATDTQGRRGFARWCSMALRAGGSLVAEFHVGEGSDDLEWTIGTVDPQVMAQWLTDGGAKSVTLSEVKGKRPTVRLVGEW
jgi:hypothetical protein